MPATEKTSYSITKLHAIFAITSVVLLIATITMFGADHSREWKGYQRTARNLDVQRIKWSQLQEQSDEHAAEIKQLGEELQQAQIVAHTQHGAALLMLLAEEVVGGKLLRWI